ncbi:MAG: S8 family serine peptidase [Chloroflexi bacterium]|uniref:S8 family peptidase n=1 Tax=Candidatus Flexifilum breve TaxID=3140694 RepID=UPI00313763C9|nr:S8 family serine peptidase [Chloroflexota bacterium]
MNRSRFSLVLLVVFVIGLLSVSALSAQGVQRSYIVLSDGDGSNLASAISAAGGTMVNYLPQIRAAVAVSSNPNFKTQVRGVRSVIPDLVYQFDVPTLVVEGESVDAAVANPPNSGSPDERFDLQWGHDAVNAPEAWAAGVRGQGVVVAVLDGGFDLDHPDLAPNIIGSISFVPTESAQFNLPTFASHGTHVAGTIGAAQNDVGTIGIAPDVDLLLVKVLADSGSGAFSWVAGGILYAADQGVDVINMSLGADIPQSGVCDTDGCITAREVAELRVMMNRVANYAAQRGVTVVVAAGNDGRDRDHDANILTLPADMPNVIAISATSPVGWALPDWDGSFDYPTSYTNYGRSAIDFSGPGGDRPLLGQGVLCTVGPLTRLCDIFDLVYSTGNNTWYWSAGTSMATPHAAGIAALIISEHGGSLAPAQVEAEMRARATHPGSNGRDPFYGLGAISSGY